MKNEKYFGIRRLKPTAMQCNAMQASPTLTCFAGLKLWSFRIGFLLEVGYLLRFWGK